MPTNSVVSVISMFLALVTGLLAAPPTAAAPAPQAAAATTQARTWVVDAVDTAKDNQWVSADTGTSTVRVTVGDTVEWQFDRATMSHDLTSLDTADDWDPRVQDYRDPQGTPIRYTFTRPGTYHYWCSIHGATMRGTVVVEAPTANRPPTATPLVDPRQGTAPLYTHFEANATDPDGDPLTYLWDFGASDLASDTSTSSHAHHSYDNPGRYTATLTVSDGRGGVLQRDFPITVTGGEAPLVVASADRTSGSAPLTVVFVGRGDDAQDTDLTYSWDFGVPGADPAAGMRASHTYTQPGTFTATLTVTDPHGNAGTDTVEIVVGEGEGEGFVLPEVRATATPSSGTAPHQVAFSTEVITDGTFAPFADGSGTYADLAGTAQLVRRRGATETTIALTGLKPNAAHMVHVHEQSCADANGGAHFRFDETAPFGEANEIWLPFTSDAEGASGAIVDTASLRAGAKAVAIVVHDPDNPAKRIGCVDLAPSTADLTYSWSFGDGTTAQGPDPDHTYARPGTYTASVTVGSAHAGHLPGHDAITTVEVQVVVAAVAPPGPTRDTREPTIRATGPRGTLRDRTPTVRATVRDDRGRLSRRQVTLRVDGVARRVRFDARTGRMTWTPGRRLTPGRHTVRLVAVDAAGNRAVARWSFRLRR